MGEAQSLDELGKSFACGFVVAGTEHNLRALHVVRVGFDVGGEHGVKRLDYGGGGKVTGHRDHRRNDPDISDRLTIVRAWVLMSPPTYRLDAQ